VYDWKAQNLNKNRLAIYRLPLCNHRFSGYLIKKIQLRVMQLNNIGDDYEYCE